MPGSPPVSTVRPDCGSSQDPPPAPTEIPVFPVFSVPGTLPAGCCRRSRHLPPSRPQPSFVPILFRQSSPPLCTDISDDFFAELGSVLRNELLKKPSKGGVQGGSRRAGRTASPCGRHALRPCNKSSIKPSSRWHCGRQSFDVDSRILTSTSKFNLTPNWSGSFADVIKKSCYQQQKKLMPLPGQCQKFWRWRHNFDVWPSI